MVVHHCDICGRRLADESEDVQVHLSSETHKARVSLCAYLDGSCQGAELCVHCLHGAAVKLVDAYEVAVNGTL